MIDLVSYLRERRLCAASRAAARGTITVGLVDAAIELDVEDLRGANLAVRSFARRQGKAPALRDHGTVSASLLVGQGRRHLRGLLPKATLLVATVSEADGIAEPGRVADAIDWLANSGACVIAVPMGTRDDDQALARAISALLARGVLVCASAGGDARTWFPARVPGVRAVRALPDEEVPAVGADGELSTRSGSSIACVIAAGLAAGGLDENGTTTTTHAVGEQA